LARIVRSYLSKRRLRYGEGKIRTVSCGVPQGSVIGPLLWNMMYDDLLEVDLEGDIQGHSSVMLVAFNDDVVVIVTGRNKAVLKLTTDKALESIARWMDRNGLTLASQKTEAVMLTNKRGYEAPTFTVNGITIEPKECLKYLGLELCRKLGFGHHIRMVSAKEGTTADGLGRILPNVGGAR